MSFHSVETHLPKYSTISQRITVKEQRNILHEISKRKANRIAHILHRN